MRTIGVDIGNSGLRASILDLEQSKIASTIRIRWNFLGPGGRVNSVGNSNSTRFCPDDGAWLCELEPLFTGQDDQWLISSVRKDARQLLAAKLDELGVPYDLIQFRDLPLACNVLTPEKVGIDRLLAAVGAEPYAPSDSDAIVIQAGSAVTVDIIHKPLSDPMRFEGGAILPGVPMMLRLLGAAADLLPELDADDLIDLPEIPGKNTEQAMLVGVSSALVGGVLHLIERYRSKCDTPLPVILSGGDGPRLAPFISAPITEVPDLVQHGLLRIAAKRTP